MEPPTPSDRPRVFLVSGPAAGGIRRHVETLIEGLPARGFAVGLAAPTSVGLDAPDGRFLLDIGDRPRPLADLRALGRLRAAAKSWQAEVVHAQGVKASLLALLAFPTGSPAVVTTFQNLWHGGPLTPLLRLLVPRATATVTITQAVRETLEAHGVHLPNLSVIPNGIDLSALPLAPQSPGRPFTAAFVGRLTEEKGVLVLLELARRLPESGAGRLLIAGDGPLRPLVEAAAREHPGRAEYLGHAGNVLPVYQAADVMLMPSLSEGQGITALEAMACGLPVVASRVGGLPEVVVDGETGFLVPTGSATALVEAVCEVARDRERGRRMGLAGRRRVEAEFTVERMLDRLVSVYEDALRPGTAPRPQGGS